MCHLQLLTVDEAAEALRLKPSTIRAWILQRRISFTRLGRRVFIRREDCDRMIVANMVTPALIHMQGQGLTGETRIGVFGTVSASGTRPEAERPPSPQGTGTD